MVPPNSSPSLKLETARTFVPGWWFHAFESLFSPADPLSTDVRLCAGGVLPRFSSQELSLLAVLLGDVQRQLLDENMSGFVELDWSRSQKQLNGIDYQARERLAGVFESFAQLRFPIQDQSGLFRVFPLFESETWSGNANGSELSHLRLKPTSIALELLTGFTDVHLDFIRRLTGGPSLASVNKGISPLVLWTPVWLELSLSEQLVYARMESAMQNESAWLGLDGLVGAPLDELTAGVKLGKKTQETASTLLMDRLRLVGKLGRRLTAHGVIQREPDNGFVALENGISSQSPLLVWQASSERLRSRAESEYFGLASTKVVKNGLTPQMGMLLSTFARLCPAKSKQVSELLEGIWTRISDESAGAFIMGPGLMTQAPMLFIEWVARSQPGCLAPLPDVIMKNPIFNVVSSVSLANVTQRYREFLSLAGRSEELRYTVKNDGQFSLASGVLRADIETVCKKSVMDYRSRKESVFVESAEKWPKNELKTPESVPANSLTVKPEPPKSQKQVTLAQNLRRLAQDELDKMIRQSPSTYTELKQKYISSLDEDTKALVMDVQRRLGSKTFDRHLRIRLVHFMVEHPASWNSVSLSLPS